MKSTVVLSLSGGMDSTTLLAELAEESEHYDIHTFSFTYGSKHNRYENKSARKIAKHYNVPFHQINLTPIMGGFTSNLMKNQGEIPEGHYTDKSMSATVVPCRNIIFISILAGYAWSIHSRNKENKEWAYVALGIHQGDHAIYPDCRASFHTAMEKALHEGTDRRVGLMAPFIDMDKTAICQAGIQLKVPYSLTRTCYKDQEVACGKCGSCQERLEAFEKNGKPDPLSYTNQ